MNKENILNLKTTGPIIDENTEYYLENHVLKNNLFKENYDSLISYSENTQAIKISDKKDINFTNFNEDSERKNTAKKSKNVAYIPSISGEFLTPLSALNCPNTPNKNTASKKQDDRWLIKENFSLKKSKTTERSISRSKRSARSRKSQERAHGSKSKSHSNYNLDSVIPLKEPKFDSFETRNSALNTSRLKNGTIYNKTESMLKQKDSTELRPNLYYDDHDNISNENFKPPTPSNLNSTSSQHFIRNSFSPLQIFKSRSFLNKTFKSSEKKIMIIVKKKNLLRFKKLKRLLK